MLLSFWNWYHVQELRYCGIKFADATSVCFDGKHNIIIKPGAKVYIGKNFISRSDSGSGIETTMTKIMVGEDATLYIGDNVGISNAVLLCKNSISIGNQVLIGGGVLLNDSNHHSID